MCVRVCVWITLSDHRITVGPGGQTHRENVNKKIVSSESNPLASRSHTCHLVTQLVTQDTSQYPSAVSAVSLYNAALRYVYISHFQTGTSAGAPSRCFSHSRQFDSSRHEMLEDTNITKTMAVDNFHSSLLSVGLCECWRSVHCSLRKPMQTDNTSKSRKRVIQALTTSLIRVTRCK